MARKDRPKSDAKSSKPALQATEKGLSADSISLRSGAIGRFGIKKSPTASRCHPKAGADVNSTPRSGTVHITVGGKGGQTSPRKASPMDAFIEAFRDDPQWPKLQETVRDLRNSDGE